MDDELILLLALIAIPLSIGVLIAVLVSSGTLFVLMLTETALCLALISYSQTSGDDVSAFGLAYSANAIVVLVVIMAFGQLIGWLIERHADYRDDILNRVRY